MAEARSAGTQAHVRRAWPSRTPKDSRSLRAWSASTKRKACMPADRAPATFFAVSSRNTLLGA